MSDTTKRSPLEDSEERIKNPDVAHEMARAEAPYREGGVANALRDAAHSVLPGQFRSTEQKAAAAVQEVGDEYLKNGEKISSSEVPEHVKLFFDHALKRIHNGAMDTGFFNIIGWYFASFDGNPDRKNGRYICKGQIDYHDEFGKPVGKGSKSYRLDLRDGEIVKG